MKLLPSAQSYSQNPNFFSGSKKEKNLWLKESKRYFISIYFLVFLMLWHVPFGVVASLALKIVVCYESAKFKLFEN